MKKIIFTIGVLMSCAVYSQVGINTEIPKATLDVAGKPSDITAVDGIIAPKLKGSELKAKDALYTDEQKASLVYVTEPLDASETTAKTVNVTSIGYFYFDGSIWQTLNATNGANPANGGMDYWSLLGNNGSSPGTNFIGTTDAQDFVVKTNNIERERTYKAATVNNTIKKIDGGDLLVNGITLGRGKGNNVNNTVVSYQGLDSNTTGANNVAVGSYSLNKNTEGNSNIALGHSSLSGNLTGSSNIALGQSAMPFNTTGGNNIAIGHSALSNTLNKTGTDNIAIGFTAGGKLEDGTSNNIVIGSKQNLASKTGSNQLNIGGAIFGTGLTGTEAAPAGNIGIGTAAPKAPLHVQTKAFDVAILERANSTPAGLSGGPYLAFRRNESDNPLVNGAVSAKQNLGTITFDGNTGDGYPVTGIRGKASIGAWADEVFTPTSKGAYLDFSTVANGTNEDLVRMRIASNGNVGIGTTTPSTKLEINNGTTNGAIKIVDGTQGDGKLLMSDADGVGTWRSVASIKPTALGIFPSPSIPEVISDGAGYKYSEIYIDLAPGKWLVSTGLTVYAFIPNARYFEHVYLSTSQTSLQQNGFVHLGPAGNNTSFSGVLTSGATITPTGGDENANFLSGTSLINVTTATRVYLLLENKPTDYWRFPTRAWENYLYALPVN